MDKNIYSLIDNLIPRGGNKPNSIYVSLEEYLSRVSNFNRKIQSLAYRIECWNEICIVHKNKFDENKIYEDAKKVIENNKDKKIDYKYSLRDIKIENEFEILLYSVSSALNAFTRVLACFIRKATQTHSHSGLPDLLKKTEGFEDFYSITEAARNSWVKEMTDRRDAATHYIALSIKSTFIHSTIGHSNSIQSCLTIGIPKIQMKYASIWEDELPTLGGSNCISKTYSDGHETHELQDSENKIIVQRNTPLDEIELIDGEKYVQFIYTSFQEYISELLYLTISKLVSNSS